MRQPYQRPAFINQRKYTRFIRKDIEVTIVKSNLIGYKETIKCKLIDISSTGVQISTPLKLGTNIKVQLILKFGTGKTFKLKAKILRLQESVHYLSNHSFPALQYFLKNKAAPLKSLHLFESNQEILMKFRDLDASSVKIFTYVPLDIKENHSLLFILNNGEQQKISSQIDQYQRLINNSYGIKFEKMSDKLGDHILETQTDLIFK
jgi:hypothetical protein